MKRIFNIKWAAAAMLSSALILSSCEEFTPVFTGKYPEPEQWSPVEMVVTHTIAELAEMYTPGRAFEIEDAIVISGKVSTSDQAGNFYRSLYIQDETGGIELKMGKTGLYNEYKPGQTVYVACKGLWLGMYGYDDDEAYGGAGMVQLGFEDPTGEYETSYIEVQYLIDQHIFRGETGEPVEPVAVAEQDLPGPWDTQADNQYVGRLVTLSGLTYGNEIFTLLYVNPNLDHKTSGNRVFLSDQTHGVTTWAMSEQKVKEHLQAGDWDAVYIGNSRDYTYGTVGDAKNKETLLKYAAPANVSQYFKMGEKEIQIRTSGYCRFADLEIDPDVLAGKKTIDATGILTMYQGNIQFVLLDQTGVKVNE